VIHATGKIDSSLQLADSTLRDPSLSVIIVPNTAETPEDALTHATQYSESSRGKQLIQMLILQLATGKSMGGFPYVGWDFDLLKRVSPPFLPHLSRLVLLVIAEEGLMPESRISLSLRRDCKRGPCRIVSPCPPFESPAQSAGEMRWRIGRENDDHMQTPSVIDSLASRLIRTSCGRSFTTLIH
jgi:hypothetical protein